MKVTHTIMVALNLLLLSPLCLADGSAIFHGKLTEVPCKVNGDQKIEFDFGRVGINKIDGASQWVTQKIGITCDQDIPTANLTLQVTGTPVSPGKSNILNTPVANLGIAIVNGDDDSKIELNKPIVITKNQLFPIKAILTKDDNNKPVAAGILNTSTTVIASYE